MNFLSLNKQKFKLLGFFALSLGLLAPARALETETPAETRAEESRPLVPARNIQSGSPIELSSEPTDFNFSNTDILFILKTFALRFNKNMITSAAVAGKVTLSLKQVPFDEAFAILLDKMGLVAIQRSPNIIEVMKRNEIPLLRETFSLKNRLASDIKATIESMQMPREKDNINIAVDGASNSLIITATSEKILEIRNLINQIDIKAPQIRIKTRILELTTGSMFSMGISWAGALRHGGVTGRAAKDIGTLNTVSVNGTTPKADLVNTTFGSGAFFDLSQVMDKASLYAVLNMIAENNNAKTLSEPSIMTGNNKTAKIHVGKNLPVKTMQVTQTATTQSISYINEGVDLEVTPVLSPGSKQISMKVRINESELSSLTGDGPITTERSAYTEITMESEKTIAIGGLVRENTMNETSGIPILRSIPVLGALFRSKSKSATKTDLLILLTPEIVTDQPEKVL